ncbi:16S rRNA (guanine(527)-N(7))-methyltransferase RsmG [Candidatus Gracilibacteria bacterium]|nr:16S rRNA (guanine(527)-N(7))-methyltransferase RsmG [Candidatus Gracilibacteria bacterium]
MKEIFSQFNIDLTQKQLELFEQFLKIFIEKNSQINLSAIRDEKEIIEKHFVDSIILKNFSSIEGKVLDLGTGGGFPGIPLKIVDDFNTEFTLVDSVGKKVNAVNEFIDKLGLTNIKAIQKRAEELGHDTEHREKYNMVVSRATAYLPTLLEYVIPLLSIGGIFVAYKLDDDEEIKRSQKALNLLNAEIAVIKKYSLNGQKRALLFIQKIGTTHKKYPRTIGEPLKNPLI